jgi:SAM-dependent methyltransferase
MAQNIYDNPEFYAGYVQLPRQARGLDGAPEWPAVRALFPDLSGRRAVDLGCGFGWVSRWMREQGAASVLGLDLSEKMIARARADTPDPRVEYRIADLDTLDLPAGAFDVAFSALAFHYVADFSHLARAIFHGLAPGGHLIFTIEHPIFMAAAHPRWIADEEGRPTWPVNRYADEGERRTDWFAKGVQKHHRTLATTVNALVDAGFAIRRLGEWAPTAAQVAERPDLAKEAERPMMLIVSAERPA